MSLQAMIWALDCAIDGKMTAKLALVAMADFADENGFCWPSQKRIVQRVGCSERALRDALDWLEFEGYITRTERRRQDGTRTTDGILLHMNEQPADFAGSDNINRQILPHQPADFAGHEPTIEPTTISSSLRSEDNTRARFARFWEVYPNKVGKMAAEKSFSKALKLTSYETLMDGLRRYINKTDDRPWCNPATWLNQGRWDDCPPEPGGRSRSITDAIDRFSQQGWFDEFDENSAIAQDAGLLPPPAKRN